MRITFFESSSAFRRWLETRHEESKELWVGFYRRSSGKGGISYPEALDEALCFGWIDGIRKNVDAIRYTIRFTPRRPGSVWSLVNTRRAQALKKLGRMTPVGLRAFTARDPKRTALYSIENTPQKLDAVCEQKFRADQKAWDFFQAQPPGYRRTAIGWVMSAIREETRLRRLARLMDDSAKGLRLAILGGAASGRAQRASHLPDDSNRRFAPRPLNP